MPQYRIMIVEDNPLVREGYETLMELEPDLDVTAAEETAAGALTRLEQEQPDLVIVDVSLPDMDGLELVRRATAMHPNLHLLVISGHDKETYTEKAFAAGARGYVDKNDAALVLMDAVRLVLGGATFPAPA